MCAGKLAVSAAFAYKPGLRTPVQTDNVDFLPAGWPEPSLSGFFAEEL